MFSLRIVYYFWHTIARCQTPSNGESLSEQILLTLLHYTYLNKVFTECQSENQQTNSSHLKKGTTMKTPSKGTHSRLIPIDDLLEIRDHLTLALDCIETGPLDLIGLRQCFAYQRAALRIGCRQMAVLETARG